MKSITVKEQDYLWKTLQQYEYNEFLYDFYDSILSADVFNKTIVGIGAGRMGYALQAFIMRLSHLGFNSYMIGDTSIPRIGKSDVVIINSSSGKTSVNILLAEIAKEAGAKIFTVTTDKNSPLAKLANTTLIYSDDEFKSVQPMKTAYEQFTFSLFDQIILDILTKYGTVKNHNEYTLNGISINENHSILE